MRPSPTSPCKNITDSGKGSDLQAVGVPCHRTAIDSQAASEDYLYICTRGGEEPIVMTFVTKIVNNWSWDRECSR